MKITVIGAGTGSEELLSEKARRAIIEAKNLYTTQRLGNCFSGLNPALKQLSLSGITETISGLSENESAAVIASGDVGFYSIASTLKKRLPDCEMELISGLSSFQYLTARLQVSYDDMRFVSLHGRKACATANVCYNRKSFFLTGGDIKAHDVVRELCESGLGDVFVCVGENLSLPEERIVRGRAAELKELEFGDLAVVYAENENFADRYRVLRDEDFVRARVPMTKQEIRDVSLAKLEIHPGDTVYDIGSGTGSVSIAMAYKAFEGTVWALEKNPEAADLTEENIRRTGAFNVRLIREYAPEGMKELPAADKVFIGGSGGNMADIFAVVLEKNPAARITVNAVTLETLTESIDCYKKFDMKYEVVCLNAAHAEKLGRYNLMKAQNPIYILTGEKQNG